MTKSEKEKAKKAQARLEALKASGMLSVTGLNQQSNAAAASDAAAKPAGGAAMYAKKKNNNNNNNNASAAAVAAADVETVTQGVAKIEVPDSWDDEDGDDDWESNITSIAAKIEERKEEVSKDVEDQLEVDNKNDHERLKQLGIERARREEEQRVKREAEEKEREEMEQREREAVVRKETSRRNRDARDAAARAARHAGNLRSPISCIMGHVDTGELLRLIFYVKWCVWCGVMLWQVLERRHSFYSVMPSCTNTIATLTHVPLWRDGGLLSLVVVCLTAY